MYNAHKKAIESLYDGICNVYEYQDVTDNTTKRTKKEEVLVQEDIKCRLSYSSNVKATKNDAYKTITQDIKVFMQSNIPVKNGSKIVITQYDHTESYVSSGQPNFYPTHQQIALEKFEGWT